MALLEHLIRYGKLGEVGLGASMAEIKAFLGDSPDTSVRSKPAVIWRYDGLQIFFDWHAQSRSHGPASMIALHFDDPYRPLPTKLAFRDFTPLPGMVEAQFEQFLASHALQWEPVPSLWWDDSQHTYQLQGAEHRCQIVFTGDLQPFTLAGIYVSAL